MKRLLTLRSLVATLFLGAGLTFATTCGEADRTFDCHAVCDRYQECLNSNYDVNGCRDRCRVKARNDADYERKADVCEDCISNQTSCVGAGFNCSTECAGFDF